MTGATSLEPLTVTVPQATELLGFKDRKVVYQLIREGEIKARKCSNRRILVNYKSLKRYAEGNN